MWRTLIFVAALGSFSASAPLYAAPKELTPENRRQETQKQQQERIQALTKRGRLTTYQQLLGSGKVRAGKNLNAYQAEVASRDTAIDLTALGFTAADVKTYSERNIDLSDVAHRFFGGATSSTEAMLMADTIVIATAGNVQAGRNRIDGFLSEIPFTVGKSLKGSRATGDVVRIPRSSGPLPDGSVRRDFSEADFKTGKTYLLVLSKNWYEQFVALASKQSESNFTALPFDAYEIADNGALHRRSHSMQVGVKPKDIKSVESDLKSLSERKNKARGLQ